MTKETLCKAFQLYLEKDLVEKVIFDIEKIKILHEEGDPPKSGAAGIINASLETPRNGTTSKNKRKKVSGSDLTALMRGETNQSDNDNNNNNDSDEDNNSDSGKSKKKKSRTNKDDEDEE